MHELVRQGVQPGDSVRLGSKGELTY
jgi:hypothetical protein